jgi:AraC-like DNA-binding protein
MEREIKSEEVKKVSVSKIKDYFSEESLRFDDYVLSPLVRFKTMTGEPRVIEGMTVGVICNGTAKAVINDRAFELRPNSLFLLRGESKISSFRCTKACTGYFVNYSPSSLEAIKLDTSDLLSVDVIFSTKPCFEAKEEEVATLHDIATAIRSISGREGMLYDNKIMTSLFASFYYAVASIINQSAVAEKQRLDTSRGDELMRLFIAELTASCERERSVEYYAKRLGITPKYLSLICKNKVGKNASKVIDAAVVNKAKELLTQPGMSIQEVAERLNFVSQSFFGKYFKQRTGISPSRYKVQN